MPDLAYLSQGKIAINTGVPSATIGSRYPVTITVSTASSDVNQGNNTTVTEVMVAMSTSVNAAKRLTHSRNAATVLAAHFAPS